eukprot:scaffold57574_cov17-Tisochrysis_lutea.AAC.1
MDRWHTSVRQIGGAYGYTYGHLSPYARRGGSLVRSLSHCAGVAAARMHGPGHHIEQVNNTPQLYLKGTEGSFYN